MTVTVTGDDVPNPPRSSLATAVIVKLPASAGANVAANTPVCGVVSVPTSRAVGVEIDLAYRSVDIGRRGLQNYGRRNRKCRVRRWASERDCGRLIHRAPHRICFDLNQTGSATRAPWSPTHECAASSPERSGTAARRWCYSTRFRPALPAMCSPVQYSTAKSCNPYLVNVMLSVGTVGAV